jgi:hypothetical protein
MIGSSWEKEMGRDDIVAVLIKETVVGQEGHLIACILATDHTHHVHIQIMWFRDLALQVFPADRGHTMP